MESWLVKSSVRSWDKLTRSGRSLDRNFFARTTSQVASDLLGKLLLVNSDGVTTGGLIVETEAYFGSDPASHSARGKTPRCAPMFEDPGIAYVYFIYGMYRMLNFVTEVRDVAGAVLIRGIEPCVGLPHIERRRKGVSQKDWTNGPGRLTGALGIEMKHNRESLFGEIFSVKDVGVTPQAIRVSPRVGIRQGVNEQLRFFVDQNHHVSRVRENKLAGIWKESQ